MLLDSTVESSLLLERTFESRSKCSGYSLKSAAHREKSRVERLKANVESLLSQVTIDYVDKDVVQLDRLIPMLTFWTGGAHPSTLEQKRAQSHSICEAK